MLYKLKLCTVQKSGKLSWGWEVIPLFTRFCTAPRWLAGFPNHQQYFVSNVLMFRYLQFQRLIGVATLAIWPHKRSKSTQIWWVRRSIFIPHLPVPYICLVGFSPTHPKNMLLKLEVFPNFRGENKKYLKPSPRNVWNQGSILTRYIFASVATGKLQNTKGTGRSGLCIVEYSISQQIQGRSRLPTKQTNFHTRWARTTSYK